MRDFELYHTVLGLQAPWDIVNVELDVTRQQVPVTVDAGRRPYPCPECQETVPATIGSTADAILNGQQPFLTAIIDADDHQGAELGLFHPHTTVNTIRPHLYPTSLVQTRFLPLLRPAVLQARYGTG